jgi:hypothetical protein
MLWERRELGGTHREIGLTWFEYSRFHPERLVGHCIAFAEVATHNHFVLDSGEKVFSQTAPAIKMGPKFTESQRLGLLAYLNSSTVCFYLKEICKDKGGSGMGRGVQDEAWEERYQFGSKKVAEVPLPPDWEALAPLAEEMLQQSARRQAARAAFQRETDDERRRERVAEESRAFLRMVQIQEKIDFEVYRLFGLIREVPDVPLVGPGGRFFEVELARRELPTAWFERHGYLRPEGNHAGISELGLPREVLLLEQPEYKRRWNMWNPLEAARAARAADFLEACDAVARSREVVSTARELVEEATRRCPLSQASDWLASGPAKAELARAAVPFLAALRHTAAGLDRRRDWERNWERQRREDRGDPVEPYEPPTRYRPKDFRDVDIWRLRDELDVPKERFISYPGCESAEDGEPVYGWAGWNHLQQALALAALYQKRKQDNWGEESLAPLLAGLLELVPWIRQWHNERDPDYGGCRADYFEAFLDGECHALGLTRDELRAWRPPEKGRAKKTPPDAAPAGDGAEPVVKPRGRKKKAADVTET